MENTVYHLKDKAEKYLSIDKHGALVRSNTPADAAGITGVPDFIQDLDFTKALTFTGQARHIIARMYFSDGINAICYVYYSGHLVGLNFRQIVIKKESVSITPSHKLPIHV